MSQELNNCHEVLGVAEGASAQELKVAYRDLAKVWHPDRFTHDPRLQQKAQEKLKEINEAYEQLTSGKVRSQQRTSGATQTHTQPHAPRATQTHAQTHPPRASHTYAQPVTPDAARPHAPRTVWQLAVLPVCVFTIVLLVAGSLLIARREPARQDTAHEVESSDVERATVEGASEAVREQQPAAKKPGPKQQPAEGMKEPIVERASAANKVTPLPTVTITIDPTSGLLATTHCPIKSRMTYADGSEPRQHCSLHHASASAPADAPRKESRLKSLTGRLASPSKWFGGKEKSGSAQRETPASSSTGNQN